VQKTKVILLCVGAATAYGVVHDQITARLCIEYFTLAHPPLFRVTSPTLLALCWGIAATIGVGILLGILLAQASQSPGSPGMPVESLYRPILAVLTGAAIGATVAGWTGYELSKHSIISLPPVWAELIPAAQQHRFMAVWFAHGASYLCGLIGGGVLIYRIWNRRQRPRLFGLFPRRGSEILRALVLVAIFSAIVWMRWFRSPD
jgi:hypothetical protein